MSRMERMKAWIDRIESQGTYTEQDHIGTCAPKLQGVMQEPKSNERNDAQNAALSLSSYTGNEDDTTVKQAMHGKKYPSIVKNVKCSGINIIKGGK